MVTENGSRVNCLRQMRAMASVLTEGRGAETLEFSGPRLHKELGESSRLRRTCYFTGKAFQALHSKLGKGPTSQARLLFK